MLSHRGTGSIALSSVARIATDQLKAVCPVSLSRLTVLTEGRYKVGSRRTWCPCREVGKGNAGEYGGTRLINIIMAALGKN